MKYYGKNISGIQRTTWLVKTFWLRQFGSTKERFIDPETGCEIENGIPIESIRDEAGWLWAMATQNCNEDEKYGKFRINKDFINQCVFNEIATDEEIQEVAYLQSLEDVIPC